MPESIGAELEQLRDRVQAFINDDLQPLEAALGEADSVPEDTRRQVRERSRELGLFQMTQPEEFGGYYTGPLALTVVRETLGAANLRVARYVFGPGPARSAPRPASCVRNTSSRCFEVRRRAPGPSRSRAMHRSRPGPRATAQTSSSPAGASRTSPTARRPTSTPSSSTSRRARAVRVHGAGVLDKGAPGLSASAHPHPRGWRPPRPAHRGCPCPADPSRGQHWRRHAARTRQHQSLRLGLAAQAVGLAIWVTEFTERNITAPHRGGGRLGDREGVRLHYGEMRMQTTPPARCSTAPPASPNPPRKGGVDERDYGDEGVPPPRRSAASSTPPIQLAGGQALILGHPLAGSTGLRSWRIAEGPSSTSCA